MKKRLVLVGGGHAHMLTLAHLHRIVQQGHHVTVIGPSDYHYYSGMGPGMLGHHYTPEQIRFNIRQWVERQGAVFVCDWVSHIDPEKQQVFTKSGNIYPYNVISFNCGSDIPSRIVKNNNSLFYTAKPIEKLYEAQQKIIALSSRQYLKVAVIGGGPAAVEIAGNLMGLLKNRDHKGFEVHLFTRGGLLQRFPPRIRLSALSVLQQSGLKIHEKREAQFIDNQIVGFTSGHRFRGDIVFLASGVRPSPVFKTSGLPIGPDGGLKVNLYLQSTQFPNIFGGGDCIYFEPHPLEKVGVYAVRQNPVLYHNISATLTGEPLKAFSPGGAYLLILNLGSGQGLFYKQRVMFKGRLAFQIKDYIDRRFMRRFQKMANRESSG